MSKFVFIYTGGAGMPEDPAEVEALMGAWTGWFEGMGAAVVDGGNPFAGATTVGPDGSTAEGAASTAGGYSIVEAADMAAAQDLARGCPTLQSGGSVEVHFALDM